MEIGPYEIVSELGRGGMGVVYRARDPHLSRDVAIKVMLQASPSCKATARFVREVELLGRVSCHPGIVGIHSAGTLPDGRLYYVMEFVPGRGLEDIIRDNPLPPPRACRYVGLAAEAVHHAHTQGVVHRDLAPKNILIDAKDRPRILDFGLARPTHEMNRLTASGTLLGTPLFMAPEQVQGAHDAGPPADIYALGATLYACLTGRAPYREGALQVVLKQILDEDPPDIPGLSADLQGIVRTAMAKDPSLRHPSAEALAADLRAFYRGERVSSRSSSSRGSQALRRRLRSLPSRGALGLVFLASVAGAAMLVHALVAGSPDRAPVPRDDPGASAVEAPSAPPPAPSPASMAVATLRDPLEAGRRFAFAFRALLPDVGRTSPDRASPFPRWEQAEREALAAALGRTTEEIPEDARRAIRTIEEAAAGDPAFRSAWIAAMGALGEDASAFEAHRRWGGSPETALVIARLALVRGEPERALEALRDFPPDHGRAAEGLLLDGLASTLLPDLGAARQALEAVRDPALVEEAAIPLALISLLVPGDTPEDRVAEGVALNAGNLGTSRTVAAHRAEALRVIDQALEAGRTYPSDLLILEASILLDDARPTDAMRVIEDARSRHPEDAAPAHALTGLVDFLQRLTTPDTAQIPVAGFDDRAGVGRILGRAGFATASFLDRVRAESRSAPIEPSVLFARARWEEPALLLEGRPVLEERARGIEAMGWGLSGRLFDRSLRRLAVASPDDLRGVLREDAMRLVRLAEGAAPNAYAAILVSALKGMSPVLRPLAGPPLGWGGHPAPAEEITELLLQPLLRSGADPFVLYGLGEALYRFHEEEDGAGGKYRQLERTELTLNAAFDGLGASAAPETHLLRARTYLAEVPILRDPGERLTSAGEEAARAVQQYRRAPVVQVSGALFLEEAAAILERAGRSADAEAARAPIREAAAVDEAAAREALRAALDRNETRSVVDLADRLLFLHPTDPVAVSFRTASAYANVGRPQDALIVAGRALRSGRWYYLSSMVRGLGGDSFGAVVPAARDIDALESPDGATGLALVRLVGPGLPPETRLAGVGLATSLVALGVAPGPLLSARAYGRLALGDERGALADARAALAAPLPGAAPSGNDPHREEYGRLARLVAALAAAMLGDDDAAATDLAAIAERDWLIALFRSPDFLDPPIFRFALAHPPFRDLIPVDVRNAMVR